MSSNICISLCRSSFFRLDTKPLIPDSCALCSTKISCCMKLYYPDLEFHTSLEVVS